MSVYSPSQKVFLALHRVNISGNIEVVGDIPVPGGLQKVTKTVNLLNEGPSILFHADCNIPYTLNEVLLGPSSFVPTPITALF